MSGIIHKCNESHIWLGEAVPSCISVARDCSILLCWATWVTMDALLSLMSVNPGILPLENILYCFQKYYFFGWKLKSNAVSQYC